jgi:hypothetical protein
MLHHWHWMDTVSTVQGIGAKSRAAGGTSANATVLTGILLLDTFYTGHSSKGVQAELSSPDAST